tara:strand:+ start:496 stop:756 length:261 start_codon:yes stop_codon:yes gene_type:complete
MVETTQGETMKSQEKSEKEAPKNKAHSKMLERGKKTAKAILEAEAREKRERRSRQIKQYAEMKMLKGHSEEQALKMAEEQITTKEW